MQKELAIVKDRLEISEHERKNLENDLIGARELLKSQEVSDRRQNIKSPKSQTELQPQESSSAKINYELIISKHFDAGRLLALTELSEIHIATATAMGQLEEMVEKLNKLHKAPWEKIIDCFEVRLSRFLCFSFKMLSRNLKPTMTTKKRKRKYQASSLKKGKSLRSRKQKIPQLTKQTLMINL